MACCKHIHYLILMASLSGSSNFKSEQHVQSTAQTHTRQARRQTITVVVRRGWLLHVNGLLLLPIIALLLLALLVVLLLLWWVLVVVLRWSLLLVPSIWSIKEPLVVVSSSCTASCAWWRRTTRTVVCLFRVTSVVFCC